MPLFGRAPDSRAPAPPGQMTTVDVGRARIAAGVRAGGFQMDMQFLPDLEPQVARANRERLAGAGVFAVDLIGGAGCGKTSLLQATIQRLLLKRRVGVITADPFTRYDADRLAALGDQVLQVDTGPGALLTARHVQCALARFNLDALDLLFIENVSSLIGPSEVDLGESAKVSMFSVAAGDDKPAKYPDVVRCAAMVVLNKVDLLPIAPFDRSAFWNCVRRINPAARTLEISTLTGEGMDEWMQWILGQCPRAKDGADVRPLAAVTPPVNRIAALAPPVRVLPG